MLRTLYSWKKYESLPSVIFQELLKSTFRYLVHCFRTEDLVNQISLLKIFAVNSNRGSVGQTTSVKHIVRKAVIAYKVTMFSRMPEMCPYSSTGADIKHSKAIFGWIRNFQKLNYSETFCKSKSVKLFRFFFWIIEIFRDLEKFKPALLDSDVLIF